MFMVRQGYLSTHIKLMHLRDPEGTALRSPELPDIPLTPPSLTNTVPPPIFDAVIELFPGVNNELQLIPD